MECRTARLTKTRPAPVEPRNLTKGDIQQRWHLSDEDFKLAKQCGFPERWGTRNGEDVWASNLVDACFAGNRALALALGGR